MTLLSIDRSTDVQSVAIAKDDGVFGFTVEGADARCADWPVKIRDFLSGLGLSFSDLDRIVVGTGPGSFAGIRGALAFAQGLAIGIRAKKASAGSVVYGLPSAAALAREDGLTAVVGDARRGLFWVVVYNGAETVSDFRLVQKDGLPAAIPESATVATSDGVRIGDVLKETFGDRYAGSTPPSAERLAGIAMPHPEILVCEPLPVYLSPAVRT